MTAAKKYYIRFRGMTTGPLDYETIAQQVTLGRITRLHELADEDGKFRPAANVIPELFNGVPAPRNVAQEQPHDEKYAGAVKTAKHDAGKNPGNISSELHKPRRVPVVAVYIAAAIVLLIDALLPTTASNGHAEWFFNGLSGRHSQIAWGGFCGLIVAICSLGLCCMPTGLLRGWLFILLSACGVFMVQFCMGDMPGAWYLFGISLAIFFAALAAGAALCSFAGSAHIPLGVLSCIFTLSAAICTLSGLDCLPEWNSSPNRGAAEVLVFSGWAAMLVSSFGAIFSGESETQSDARIAKPGGVLTAAGFITLAWLLLAMSCFFLLPISAEGTTTMTALPMLRLVIAWICLGILAGGGAMDIIQTEQGETQNVIQPKGQ